MPCQGEDRGALRRRRGRGRGGDGQGGAFPRAVTGASDTPSIVPHLPPKPGETAGSAMGDRDAGAAAPPLSVRTVLGILGGIGADRDEVMHIARTAGRVVREGGRRSVPGGGRNRMTGAAMAAAMGVPVRVGLGASLRGRAGTLARHDTAQVSQVSAARPITDGIGLAAARCEEPRPMPAPKGGKAVVF